MFDDRARLLRRLWGYIEVGFPTGCWQWKGQKDKDGYGKFRAYAATVRPHRFVWTLLNGPIPDGLLVRHFECRNRACVNPAHLRLGTAKENSADAIRDGTIARGDRVGRRLHPERYPIGEDHGRAKLTERDVIAIRAEYTGRFGQKSEMARRYGVTVRAITTALLGITWKHLKEGLPDRVRSGAAS